MDWKILFKNRNYLILASIILFLFIIMISIIMYLTISTKNVPISTNYNSTITSTPQTVSPGISSTVIHNSNFTTLQKTVIGKTPENSINGLPNILNKITLQNGENAYNITSELTLRPNQIITQNGVVVYESDLTPENPQTNGYALITDYLKSLGTPEKIIKGSKFYGWSMQTYIYGKKGVAFIGNPDTNEVLEIHFFQPMSTDEYINKYGDDLDPNASPHEDYPLTH